MKIDYSGIIFDKFIIYDIWGSVLYIVNINGDVFFVKKNKVIWLKLNGEKEILFIL